MDEVEQLLEKLKDSDGGTREDAAYSLGEIGDVRAVPALIRALEDVDEFVRRNAADALGKIGDPRAVVSLIDKLGDVDVETWQSVRWALGEIAKKADVDLDEVEASLREFVDGKKDSNERERAKHLAAQAYVMMANAVYERKKAQLPKDMLPARFKPPKKSMYRMRRAVV